MTNCEIESFLAICRCRTVSRAAETLYVTQSSLSTRLKTLETELGGALFHRRKGSREMTLTEAGRRFYELAVRYEALTQEMKQVCRQMPAHLRVSSLNSVDTFLLPEVYERFLQKYPETRLEIRDMEGEAASLSIRSGGTDLAFTAGKITEEGVRQTPAFAEPMVLISTGSDLREPVQPEALPLRSEVYIEWSRQFAHWHQQLFDGARPQLRISIMSHLQQFLDREHFWAFVPVSVAMGLAKTRPIRRLATAFALPMREISILSAADEGENPAIAAFCQCLREALAAYPEIEVRL